MKRINIFQINDTRVDLPAPHGFKKILREKPFDQPMNEGESIFHKTNPEFIFHPSTFYFDQTRYTPDFYDRETRTLFEVIGTRQRYHQGQESLIRLKEICPDLKLIVCDPSGEELKPRKRDERKEKISVAALAKEAGVSENYLYMIFRGERRPLIDKARKLEEATGIPVLAWFDPGKHLLLLLNLTT